MFNKMDPFATVVYREQKFKTKVLQGAGKTPKWNETFDFDIKYTGDDLKLTIMDEDTMSNDKVGEVSIKVAGLCIKGGLDDWFTIQYKGKQAGKVHVKSSFVAREPDTAPSTGKLKLTVKEAKLTRDTEMAFNKMDPYCELKYRQQDFKTKVL
jgi:Ca2+-dependent lipid-binding protein